MKLSRHGKHTNHSRRGRRHTKRAGKHLKYRGKKVRVSKRYSRVTGGRGRGRGHTKKNLQNIYGRRFMKGGVVCGGVEYDWVWGTSADGQNFTCTIEVTLRYKKNLIRSITAANSQFQVEIRVGSNFIGCKADTGGIWGDERLSLKFIRQTPDSPLEFQFDTYLDFISALGEHIVDWVPSSRNFVRDIISNVPMRYNFNFKENTKILDCIRDFIRNKIIDVYIDTLLLLGNCEDNYLDTTFKCRDSEKLFGFTLESTVMRPNTTRYEVHKSNIELLILIGKCILRIYSKMLNPTIEGDELVELKKNFIYIIVHINYPHVYDSLGRLKKYKEQLQNYLGENPDDSPESVLTFISNTFPGRSLPLAATAVVPATNAAATNAADANGDDGTAN